MAMLVSQERPQSTQGLLKNEASFSEHHQPEKEAEVCLELPQLARGGLEWSTVDDDSPVEPYVNFPAVELSGGGSVSALHSSQATPGPLCVSTPDIQRTTECINEHLSHQITACSQSKNELRRSSTYTCRLSSQSQVGLSNHSRNKSLNSEHNEKLMHKRIICDFEKHLTFRPTLNEHSMRIASKRQPNSVPAVHRLLEARRNLPDPYEYRLTFAPKLNAASLRMAQERAAKMSEVRVRCHGKCCRGEPLLVCACNGNK